MSRLLIHPSAPDARGVVQNITPQSAGWDYVGFEVRDLAAGATARGEDSSRETCLVLVRGRARIVAGGQDFGLLGGRTSPFESGPHSVYVPPRMPWQVVAEGPVELAVCTSPAKGGLPARAIGPAEAGELTRGSGTNARLVRDFPRETYLEETYYHRLARGSGFALQRVYTKDGSLDETMAIADRDVVLVPKGYHPVGAPHGFDLYYLNVMAGPLRQWKFSMDPDQAHLPY